MQRRAQVHLGQEERADWGGEPDRHDVGINLTGGRKLLDVVGKTKDPSFRPSRWALALRCE
jgi:hypothetical protein